MKIDTTKVFEAICDSAMHSISTKEVLGKMTIKEIRPILHVLNEERRNRSLPSIDFRELPVLLLDWNEWNSGGGCMIWSFEYSHYSTGSCTNNTHSIHVSDECAVHANCSTEEYWEMESNEEQECTHLNEYMYWKSNPKISQIVCQYTGQELADKIALDMATLWDYMNNYPNE